MLYSIIVIDYTKYRRPFQLLYRTAGRLFGSRRADVRGSAGLEHHDHVVPVRRGVTNGAIYRARLALVLVFSPLRA